MLRVFRFLNLEIIIGVAGCHLLICRELLHAVDPYYFLFLISSTWLVYTLDRLFEQNQEKFRHSELHKWYKQHFILLSVWAFLLSLLLIFSFFNLKSHYIIYAAVPVGIGFVHYVSLYFFDRLYWLKDFLIALAYSTAITLPIWFETSADLLLPFLVCAGLFLLAYINMFFTSFSEYPIDFKIGEKNAFSHSIISKYWVLIICLCLSLLLVMIIFLWANEAYFLAAFYGWVGLCNFLILLYAQFVKETNLSTIRIMADVVLMTSFPAYLLCIWFDLC